MTSSSPRSPGRSTAYQLAAERWQSGALGSSDRRHVELQPEAVGHAGEVVEHADDVGDLEASLVAEAELAQLLPVALDHAGRRGAQLFGDLAQRPLALGERGHVAPALLPHRSGELLIPVLRTEELSVGLRSIDAVLRRGGDAGDELTLLVGEDALAEHRLEEQGAEALADARMCGDQPGHVRVDAVVAEVSVGRRELDPGVVGHNVQTS